MAPRVQLVATDASEIGELAQDWPDADRLVLDGQDAGPPSERYDTVVVSEAGAGDDRCLRTAAAHVAPAGVLAITCRGRGRRLTKRLHTLGMRRVNAYGLLPPGRPWLFVPLRTAGTRAQALTCHTPSNVRSSLAAGAARWASRVGVTWPIARRCLVLARPEAGDGAADDILAYLSDGLDTPVSDVVVMGRDHRTVMLLLAADARPIGVVKLAGHAAGHAALAREAEALRCIARGPLAGHAPRLLFEGGFGDLAVQVQSFVPAEARRGQQTLTPAHLAFLASMTRIEAEQKPLDATTGWRDIADHFDAATASADSAAAALLARFREDDRQRPVLCHRTHGDFTPWNIRAATATFMVIDWEESECDGVVGSDLLTFIFRQAACVGPWRSAAEVTATMDAALAELLARIGYDRGQAALIKRWWLLWEYVRQPLQRDRLEALAALWLEAEGARVGRPSGGA